MKTLLLIALQLGASGSDAYFTHRNQQGFRPSEMNPLAAPFVHSTRGQVLFFSTGAAVHIGGSILLRKHHHEKLGDAWAVYGIASNTFGATYSATHP